VPDHERAGETLKHVRQLTCDIAQQKTLTSDGNAENYRAMPASFQPSDAATTPSSLIVGIREGSPIAWQRFNAIFGPLIYGWCRRKGLQANDAADVVQDVLRSVLRAIDTFRRDQPGNSFQGWVWTITHSRLADHFRKRANQPKIALSKDVPEPESSSSNDGPTVDWRSELVRRIVQQLSVEFQPSSWQAFWRMVVVGEPADQIALDLQISAAAVRQAKYRVLQRLRSELSDLGVTPEIKL
jgi:RNA polymerase sigma-70 factor (ECF subfamily)